MADSNQVQRLRDLLSQAVQCIGTSSTSSSLASSSSASSSSASSSSSSSAQILPQTIRERSIHSERNLLFNFGARRPKRLQPRNVPAKSKKKSYLRGAMSLYAWQIKIKPRPNVVREECIDFCRYVL